MNYLKEMISFIHDGELEITFIDTRSVARFARPLLACA